MKLNEIRAFVTVAETGSIQAAALRLNMTQSAVSRLVQRLEAELRVVLFDRRTKPLALTRDSRTALDLGGRVLAMAREFSDVLSPAAEPKGNLRIGAAHAVASLVTGRPLDMLRSKYPQLAVQISSDWTQALLDRVSAGGLEAAVVLLPADAGPGREIYARKLRNEDIQIIGAARLASRKRLSLQDLNDIGWVVQPEGCGYRAALTRGLDRSGAGPLRVAVEAFGYDLQLSVIAKGAGFGLLPASQLKAIPKRLNIRTFKVSEFRLVVSLWFVRQRHPGKLAGALDAVESALSDSE